MDRRAALKLALSLAVLSKSRAGWADDALAVDAKADLPAPDALARWLAGMRLPADAGEAAASDGEAWLAYARLEDARWRREAARVSAMRRWAKRELGARVTPDRAVLYPFAGADALHALALFGGAGRVQLVGLEPVGDLPALHAAPDAAYFAALGDALGELHRLTYFRTRGMSRDLARPGVLPALVATVARMGGHVRQVTRTASPDGATIAWTGDDGRDRELSYARLDLSNDGLVKQAAAFAGMRRRLSPYVTFVKASSYLLADPAFAHGRQALLEDSDLVVQDDSGLPYRDLAGKWTVRLYGTYTRPASPFQDRVQADLAAAYATAHPAPLPFGVGYFTQPERSNLLVATRALP